MAKSSRIPTKDFVARVVQGHAAGENNRQVAESLGMEPAAFTQRLTTVRNKIRKSTKYTADQKASYLQKLQLERAPGGGAPKQDEDFIASLIDEAAKNVGEAVSRVTSE